MGHMITKRRHKDKVANLGCILCRHLGLGETPAQLHHPRAGMGMGQRASDFDVIPLCHEHHLGKTGIHGMGTKAFTAKYGLTEKDLLDMTREVAGVL